MKEEGKRIKFGFAPGALDMLKQAKKDERHEEHTVHLTGDLCQMNAQSVFLKSHGIDVQFNNVYPCVKECEKKETFELLWKYKCHGWWHYSSQYVKLGICTDAEFMETLSKWYEAHNE